MTSGASGSARRRQRDSAAGRRRSHECWGPRRDGTGRPPHRRRDPHPAARGLARLRDLPDPIDPDRPIVCIDTETTGWAPRPARCRSWSASGAGRATSSWSASWCCRTTRTSRPCSRCSTAHPAGRDRSSATTAERSTGRSSPVGTGCMAGLRFAAHLDLLGLARQVWKHRLPDARLASVEAGVCGVRQPVLPHLWCRHEAAADAPRR